jgi:hypothetical protein
VKVATTNTKNHDPRELRKLAVKHREAAARHQEAAAQHEEMAAYWEDDGDTELAELERRTAVHSREGASIETARAELMDRRAR